MVLPAVPLEHHEGWGGTLTLLKIRKFLMDLISLNETKSNVKRYQRISC